MKLGDIVCGALRLPTDQPPMFVIHRGPVVEFNDMAVHIESANTGEPVVIPRMLVTDTIDESLFNLFDYVSTMLIRMKGNLRANPVKVFGWVAQKAAMEVDMRASVVIVDCGEVYNEPPEEKQPEYQETDDGGKLVPMPAGEGTYEAAKRLKRERLNRRRAKQARRKKPVVVH